MFKTKSRTKRGRAPGRGTLFAISALLVGSALVRIGDDTGKAFAKASPDSAFLEIAADSNEEACETPEDFHLMLNAFRERESRIESQETAIRDRLHALDFANREIDRKLAQLTRAEDELRETIALADTAAENDLDRLTRVYENMKPKQAAALFEEMDPNFAAGFLGRMRPEAAAAVMAGLSPEAAHIFSVVLAGRNADVPTE